MAKAITNLDKARKEKDAFIRDKFFETQENVFAAYKVKADTYMNWLKAWAQEREFATNSFNSKFVPSVLNQYFEGNGHLSKKQLEIVQGLWDNNVGTYNHYDNGVSYWRAHREWDVRTIDEEIKAKQKAIIDDWAASNQSMLNGYLETMGLSNI